jgi:hypothetical protein
LVIFHDLVSTYFGGHLMHQSTQQQKVPGNSRLQSSCQYDALTEHSEVGL